MAFVLTHYLVTDDVRQHLKIKIKCKLQDSTYSVCNDFDQVKVEVKQEPVETSEAKPDEKKKLASSDRKNKAANKSSEKLTVKIEAVKDEGDEETVECSNKKGNEADDDGGSKAETMAKTSEQKTTEVVSPDCQVEKSVENECSKTEHPFGAECSNSKEQTVMKEKLTRSKNLEKETSCVDKDNSSPDTEQLVKKKLPRSKVECTPSEKSNTEESVVKKSQLEKEIGEKAHVNTEAKETTKTNSSKAKGLCKSDSFKACSKLKDDGEVEICEVKKSKTAESKEADRNADNESTDTIETSKLEPSIKSDHKSVGSSSNTLETFTAAEKLKLSTSSEETKELVDSTANTKLDNEKNLPAEKVDANNTIVAKEKGEFQKESERKTTESENKCLENENKSAEIESKALEGEIQPSENLEKMNDKKGVTDSNKIEQVSGKEKLAQEEKKDNKDKKGTEKKDVAKESDNEDNVSSKEISNKAEDKIERKGTKKTKKLNKKEAAAKESKEEESNKKPIKRHSEESKSDQQSRKPVKRKARENSKWGEYFLSRYNWL